MYRALQLLLSRLSGGRTITSAVGALALRVLATTLAMIFIKIDACEHNKSYLLMGTGLVKRRIACSCLQPYRIVLRFPYLSRCTAMAAFPCHADWLVLEYRQVPRNSRCSLKNSVQTLNFVPKVYSADVLEIFVGFTIQQYR